MPVSKRQMTEWLENKVREDGLRYSYEYSGWNLGAATKLRSYLCDQSEKWSLNEKSLERLCEYFNNEYTSKTLRNKCFEYGIDYEFDWGDKSDEMEEKEDYSDDGTDEDIDL